MELGVAVPMFCVWIVVSISLVIKVAEVSGLSCSQCESPPGGECMTSPPPSVPCESPDEGQVNMNCMIARHLTNNDTLVFFSRGCTVVSVGNGCVGRNENISLCYTICHYDHCNSGQTLTTYKQQIAWVCALSYIIHRKFV